MKAPRIEEVHEKIALIHAQWLLELECMLGSSRSENEARKECEPTDLSSERVAKEGGDLSLAVRQRHKASVAARAQR